MAENKNLMSDAALDALLDELAEKAPDPSSELMGRVLADAYEVQPEPAPLEAFEPETSVAAADSVLSQLVSVFGGWGGIGGLAVAASVGFFMGFSPPSLLEETLPEVLGYDLSLDLGEAGFGWDSVEDAL